VEAQTDALISLAWQVTRYPPVDLWAKNTHVTTFAKTGEFASAGRNPRPAKNAPSQRFNIHDTSHVKNGGYKTNITYFSRDRGLCSNRANLFFYPNAPGVSTQYPLCCFG